MQISWCTLADVAGHDGTVVVIDVLRAFTTAAVALDAGAGPYELVATLEEAHARRAERPGTLLMGEVDGYTAPGFDLGNSPTALHGRDLAGTPIVHRSTSGTQGVVRAVAARRVLTASFAVAGATARALVGDDRIAFCATGADAARDGEEDRACGEYIAALLADPSTDPAPFTARVATSTAAAQFAAGHADLPAADVPFAQVVDRYDFAMQVTTREGRHLLHRLDA